MNPTHLEVREAHARQRERLCCVHDVDDVWPGRICGRLLPCREHTMLGPAIRHADFPECDPETGRDCPACVRMSRIEAEDARRLYDRLDRSIGTYEEQMRDAGRGHLVR